MTRLQKQDPLGRGQGSEGIFPGREIFWERNWAVRLLLATQADKSSSLCLSSRPCEAVPAGPPSP